MEHLGDLPPTFRRHVAARPAVSVWDVSQAGDLPAVFLPAEAGSHSGAAVQRSEGGARDRPRSRAGRGGAVARCPCLVPAHDVITGHDHWPWDGHILPLVQLRRQGGWGGPRGSRVSLVEVVRDRRVVSGFNRGTEDRPRRAGGHGASLSSRLCALCPQCRPLTLTLTRNPRSSSDFLMARLNSSWGTRSRALPPGCAARAVTMSSAFERRVPHQAEILGVEGNLLRRSS